MTSRRLKVMPVHHNEVEKAFFGELVFLIKTFFFVYLGLSVRLTDTWVVTVALALVTLLLVARLLSVRLTTAKDTAVREALIMGVMIPKGTAAAVLASIPLQMALPQGEQIQNIVYAVVVLSILGTAFLVFLVERGVLVPVVRPFFGGYAHGRSAGDTPAAEASGTEPSG